MIDAMMQSRLRCLALTVALGVGAPLSLAGFAHAAPQSNTFFVSQSLQTDSFGYTQFDPGLGLLTGVTITTLHYGITHRSDATLISAFVGDRLTVTQSGTLNVTGPNGVLLNATAGSSATCVVNVGTNCRQDDTGNHSPDDLSVTAFYNSPEDLAAFIGNGIVTLSVSIIDYVSSIRQTFGNTTFSSNSMSYEATIAIQYSFSQAPETNATEPASLALFGLGLEALSIARRRRQ